MYSTCLYCTGNLGSNDVLETLPIGRRVAFDAAQGRLWVVCRRCEKWNLVPFDTRLETIDACERYFSEARLRFSTDNIGIARVQEGMELVRIGPAERPEFAAWRYGDQFGRRRKRMAVQFVAASAVAGALVVSRHLLLPIASGGFGLQVVNWAHILYRRRRAVVRVPERDGVGGVMTVSQAQQAAIVTHGRGDWSLRVKMYDRGRAGFATGLLSREIDLSGDHAVEA
ncbi:MAG: hypothetical protein ACRELE_05365, partial [Gemmatimonadales bacterium]